MTKPNKLPQEWTQVKGEIQEALILDEKHSVELRLKETNSNPFGVWERSLTGPEKMQAKTLDIETYELGRNCIIAFNYAYQVQFVSYLHTVEATDTADRLSACIPASVRIGLPSLLRMVTTCVARVKLFEQGYSPTINDLSLLASMPVIDVAASLRKEGLQPKKPKYASEFMIDPEKAKRWLLKCRHFIPQRLDIVTDRSARLLEDSLQGDCSTFTTVTKKLMKLRNLDAYSAASRCSVDPSWLVDLLEGRYVEADVLALQSLARGLEISKPTFVAAGVRHLLSLEDVSV